MSSFAISRDARARRALVAMAAALAIVVGAAPAVQALGRSVAVIVMGRDAVAAVETAQGSIDRFLPIIDGVAAHVPEGRLADVAARARFVSDRAMHVRSASYGDGLVSAYPVEVGARSLWSSGVTGQGVTVAIVDTGIADVPDLAGRVVARANFTTESSDTDTYGHGTFQAGLIAGDGSSSSGRYTGVAPGVSLLSVKVADAAGTSSLSQVLAGIELVDWSADQFGVRVMLLALDSQSPLPPEIDPLSLALRRVWSHGIVVVVPQGNNGPDGNVGSPGEDPVLLTAGSVYDQGTATPDDDTVSAYSSRGPTRWGDEKPDVAAPGEHLVSLRAPGSTVDVENPNARVEDAYFRGSGTSMSAAVTAGAAALLVSARPDLSPDHVKALLMGTASATLEGDATTVGAGVVDASRAVAFTGALPELPDQPDMGQSEHSSELGERGGWTRGADGVWRWVARQWNARQWNEHHWTEGAWDARQWADREWTARQWLARQWAARQWAARQWTARQWTARQWNARQWTADQWDARQWTARQWTARQWTARQWTARQWSARQWNSDQWDARQWTARQWTARQWNARQWSSTTWD